VDTWDQRVVVITGASAGVGRATVRALAKRGAWIGLIARGVDGLEATRQEVEAAGGRALAIPLDVADAEAVDVAAARVEDELGPIDVWINNAMVSMVAPVDAMTPTEFRRVTEVTYLGVVHGTLAALRHMRPRDAGVIVQIGSGLAYRALPLQSAYSAAKHAVHGFTESLRSELIHDGSHIRLTMVQLPALNTPQFGWVRTRLAHEPKPLPPIYQPEVAAEAIIWAAEHDRREVNVGSMVEAGIVLNRLAPGLLDRYLAATAYEGQQAGRPVDPTRQDNLDFPLPGDHGAHGAFDAEAKPVSRQFWAATHRPLVAGAIASAAALAFLALRRGRS
jgi:NAD(P)-dependent dehydrogenase (short-subunit alcohol dehydrogenase family)